LGLKYIGLAVFFFAIFILTYQYNQRLLEWLRFQSIGTRDYIVEKLSQMFIEIAPEKILLALLFLSFGMGAIIFILFIPNWVPGFLFAGLATVVGWKAPAPIVDMMYRRRVKKFVLQMVDALSLMSNGMKSGLSVVQAIGLVVSECPDPIRQEFNLVLSENRLGVSLEDSLLNLSKRIRADDVEMFVTSVNILKETGGNLAETFDTIVLTIRDRIKVEKKIESMTAQGFYQAMIVGFIPTALGVVFYMNDPEFMDPILHTTIGWIVIFVVLLLQFLGIFVALKVVKINV